MYRGEKKNYHFFYNNDILLIRIVIVMDSYEREAN